MLVDLSMCVRKAVSKIPPWMICYPPFLHGVRFYRFQRSINHAMKKERDIDTVAQEEWSSITRFYGEYDKI